MLIDIAYASGAAEKATEAAAEGGVLGSLGINTTLFLFQLFNFLLVATILWFLILKPLTKKMAERQRLIDDSIDNARKIESNLMMSEKKYQEKIDVAKVEANKILAAAQEEANRVGEEMKLKAKKEIEALVDHARKNIKLEKEEAVSEVKKQAADLIIAATEKMLSTKVEKHDGKIIEEALLSVGKTTK